MFKFIFESFATDNATNMKVMRYEGDILITYECAVHILNLLANDLNIENLNLKE